MQALQLFAEPELVGGSGARIRGVLWGMQTDSKDVLGGGKVFFVLTVIFCGVVVLSFVIFYVRSHIVADRESAKRYIEQVVENMRAGIDPELEGSDAEFSIEDRTRTRLVELRAASAKEISTIEFLDGSAGLYWFLLRFHDGEEFTVIVRSDWPDRAGDGPYFRVGAVL